MTTMAPGECPHPESRVSWRGTNAHIWKWTCSQCGATQSHRKIPGAEKPVPGRQRGLPSVEDSGGRSAGGSQASGSQAAGHPAGGQGELLREEVIFNNPQDWQRFSHLLDRMVVSHMAIYGHVTHNDFQHITNATSLCYKQFGPVFAGPAPSLRSASSAAPHQSTASTSDAGDISGNNKITFGRYKGYTFGYIYDTDYGYVQFCLDEKSKGEAYCTNMKRFQDYCERRREEEAAHPVAYMVSSETPLEEGTDEDEDFLIYLDSGCNSTCHGELWMKKYIEGTGYDPEWDSRVERFFTGIGGSTRCLGVRKLYVGLETTEDYRLPGELYSTEIAGSQAPIVAFTTEPGGTRPGGRSGRGHGEVQEVWTHFQSNPRTQKPSHWIETSSRTVSGPCGRALGVSHG